MPDSRGTRSIETPPSVSPSRLFGRPILEPDPHHVWESRVVLNPAAVLVDNPDELRILCDAWTLPSEEEARLMHAGGACVMLYRAQGERDEARDMAPSSLGLAVFTPELEFVWRRAEPVMRPNESFHDLGVEDPRCTRVGDVYYLFYTGYARDGKDKGRVRICLATSLDFLHWDLHGPIEGDVNEYPNKNPAFLPVRVNDRWLLLHRPMSGPDAMTVHLAEASDPAGRWKSLGPLMESHPYREFSKSWIGAGGPPISLGTDQFLMIYHQGHFTSDGRREYDLAAALLDFRRTDPVRVRIEPMMRPTDPLEQHGNEELGVDNVLFTCANYVHRERLYIPYAGADSRIFGAAIEMDELVGALEAVG